MTPSTGRPEARAFQLRRDLGITERSFDLARVIEQMDIQIQYEELPDDGQEGASFQFQGRDTIIIDPRRRTLAGQRFTLAHELGHIILGHTNAPARWGLAEGAPGNREENEANQFAGALLMPRKRYREDMKGQPTTFTTMERLASLYDVSLTAATIRYTTLTDDYAATIGTDDQKAWVVKARTVTAWWILLPPSNESLITTITPETPSATGRVPATAWIENYDKDNWEIHEEARTTTPHTKLSLLTNIPDPEDDNDWEEQAAEQERQERRQRFSRY